MAATDLNALVTAAQGTNISTAVTCNARHGQITTQGMDAAAAAENAFTVNNNRVSAASVIVAHISSTASTGTPIISVGSVAAGSFVITITNVHSADALNAAAVISFLVIK